MASFQLIPRMFCVLRVLVFITVSKTVYLRSCVAELQSQRLHEDQRNGRHSRNGRPSSANSDRNSSAGCSLPCCQRRRPSCPHCRWVVTANSLSLLLHVYRP